MNSLLLTTVQAVRDKGQQTILRCLGFRSPFLGFHWREYYMLYKNVGGNTVHVWWSRVTTYPAATKREWIDCEVPSPSRPGPRLRIGLMNISRQRAARAGGKNGKKPRYSDRFHSTKTVRRIAIKLKHNRNKTVLLQPK